MRKKISLREFQEYLAKRLTSAARGEGSAAMLGVQSGNTRWLLNLSESGEIIPLPTLTPVPLTRPWFAGMANIRGNLFSVVDFSAFCGGDPTPQNATARLVLVGSPFGINSAILVNRMLGLKALDTFHAAAPKAPLPPWVSDVVTDGDEQPWQKLNVPGLLAAPAFMQVGL